MAGISKKTYPTKKGQKTVYVITYRDIYGKQHTNGCFATKREALQNINNYENINPESNKLRMKTIFDIYFQHADSKYAKNTLNAYRYYYNKYFKLMDTVEYAKINSVILQKLFDDIENDSPHVAQTCLKFCKAAVNYSIKHGKLVRYNIFNDIERIKLPKADINHLNKKELQIVLEKCIQNYSDYYMILFTFIGTGIREGELIALEKSDFNYTEKTLVINKQFTKGEVKKTKTVTSNRIVYLFDVLADKLYEYSKTLSPDCKLLFPNKNGGYLNDSNLRERFWKPLLKECGITKRVRLHDLRGSYADLMFANGTSVKFVQNQLGHAKADITCNIYAKNNSDMILYAQNVSNNIFSEKCENNVRITEKTDNKKIIPFPLNRVRKGF